MSRMKRYFFYLLMFFLWIISVVIYSEAFYAALFAGSCLFLLSLVISRRAFLTIVYISLLLLSMFHGWRGMSDILSDYIFSYLLKSIFFALCNFTLVRLLFSLYF